MEIIALIDGKEREGKAAFSRKAIKDCGGDSQKLITLISNDLQKYAPLLNDGAGFGLVLEGGNARIVGFTAPPENDDTQGKDTA